MAKLKKMAPNILLVVGGALLLVFVVYTAFTYPWRMLLANWGWIDLEDELPDPKPLPAELLDYDGGIGEEELGILPGDGGWLGSRPTLQLNVTGMIKIPRIQLSENIVEGTGDELYYGVGHVRSTAQPGEEGNCVLSGHRNYIRMRPFRYLDRLEVGDRVYVITQEAQYAYEVFQLFEITVDDLWILEPQEVESHLLTLLTCTPPMAIDPPTRLIAWCSLVETRYFEEDEVQDVKLYALGQEDAAA